ncbi:MAG: IS21 family transposase, partial [Ktedonobacteraceae bacterium]|nr:IS21 family transposase [Ktedonobacteraceae bacterium]
VLNARKLYGEILAQGYPGKESKVREFVHDRRPEKEPIGSTRFETAPGEQGQVDWGYFGFITHHGRTCRLYAFVMTLGWSRASYVRFTISSDTTWFIRCHLHAFAYLGGVPRRLLYDNLKSVVERRDADEGVHWNPRFLDFADVAGFSPQACKPYRPQTKGKVENGVKYVRGNFWPGLHFRDLEDLNNQALAWLNTTANQRVHGTTGEVPFTRLRSEGLQEASKAFIYDTSVMTTRRSSKDCLISYEGNLYSVPAAYARKTLQVKITEAQELVICSEVGQELARHRVLLGRQERSVQAEHYQGLGIPAPRVEQVRAMQEIAPAQTSMFWDAPVVEVRPLSVYDQLLWEVS